MNRQLGSDVGALLGHIFSFFDSFFLVSSEGQNE